MEAGENSPDGLECWALIMSALASSDHYVARVRQAGNAGLDVGLSGDGCFQDMLYGVAEDLA